MLHVPQDEVGREGAKTGSDVGLGEVQLTRVTQAAASEPGNVLNELEEAKEWCESPDAFSTFREHKGGTAKPHHSI